LFLPGPACIPFPQHPPWHAKVWDCACCSCSGPKTCCRRWGSLV
jgi:hypothetical protein